MLKGLLVDVNTVLKFNKTAQVTLLAMLNSFNWSFTHFIYKVNRQEISAKTVNCAYPSDLILLEEVQHLSSVFSGRLWSKRYLITYGHGWRSNQI